VVEVRIDLALIFRNLPFGMKNKKISTYANNACQNISANNCNPQWGLLFF